MAPQTRQLHVLLVEDNPDHALIATRALRKAQPELREQLVITSVTDGALALAVLGIALPDPAAGERGAGSPPPHYLPDLVLLDLKMPGIGGLQVLEAIRADARLRVLPVIVLTTSARDDDVLAAYRLGANEYVTKPVGPEEFRTKVQSIPQYWSKVVQRPPPMRSVSGSNPPLEGA